MSYQQLRVFGLVCAIVGTVLRVVSSLSFGVSTQLVLTRADVYGSLLSSGISPAIAELTVSLFPALFVLSLIELFGCIFGIFWSNRLVKHPSKGGAILLIGIGFVSVLGWILNSLTSSVIPLTLLTTAITMLPVVLLAVVAYLVIKKMRKA
ncbi:hypothetical protein [Culicoidibacter larvae]|uniref:Uncharacterized protein n=1 Tax=Culicoidibacter larvae TaxID=2579976 RepID=A0A5R8Q8Z1_9FIRM|nr:hypothetical protein [Culicoidibacter larvae]TLG72105.1 hypothetical protein FEZ08_09745 [Culicoidibacter larvae]